MYLNQFWFKCIQLIRKYSFFKTVTFLLNINKEKRRRNVKKIIRIREKNEINHNGVDLTKYRFISSENTSNLHFFDWKCLVEEKQNSKGKNDESTKHQNKIIKKINRDLIDPNKLNQSLKEAIAFKLIKSDKLMHNYIDYYINEKHLYVVLDSIDLVNIFFSNFKTRKTFLTFIF